VTADCATTTSGCINPQPLAETTYDNGTCFTPLPNTMNPTWAADLNTPSVNCFQTAPVNITLDFDGILLPLFDTVLAGEWNADPATAINLGVMRGYLRKSDADAIDLLPVLNLADTSGNFWLSTLLPGGRSSSLVYSGISRTVNACRGANEGSPNYERDNHATHGVGWWFYINYNATKLNDWYTP
jgi:hypothetical protein